MSEFRYKVGQKVTVTYPGFKPEKGKIIKRTIEPALHKTYYVRTSDGRNLGYVPEAYLELR